MSTYDFGPEILPFGRNPIECSFDENHEDEGYQTYNGIYAKCHDGFTWCAACARQRYVEASLDDICPSCSTKAHPFEARLRRTLVGIKIAFREQLFREQPDEGLAFSRTKSYAKKKYGEAWVMHQQCAVGLIRIADALRLEFPVGDGSPVKRISEIEFSTPRFYGYRHCAFVLYTDHGTFVFDPTGAQFGPSWPVVTTFKKYGPRIRIWRSIEALGSRKQKFLAAA